LSFSQCLKNPSENACSRWVFVEQPGKRIDRTVETKLGMQRIGLESILPADHLSVAEMFPGAE
jgi:hypothetical protein